MPTTFLACKDAAPRQQAPPKLACLDWTSTPLSCVCHTCAAAGHQLHQAGRRGGLLLCSGKAGERRQLWEDKSSFMRGWLISREMCIAGRPTLCLVSNSRCQQAAAPCQLEFKFKALRPARAAWAAPTCCCRCCCCPRVLLLLAPPCWLPCHTQLAPQPKARSFFIPSFLHSKRSLPPIRCRRRPLAPAAAQDTSGAHSFFLSFFFLLSFLLVRTADCSLHRQLKRSGAPAQPVSHSQAPCC